MEYFYNTKLCFLEMDLQYRKKKNNGKESIEYPEKYPVGGYGGKYGEFKE